MAGPDEHIELAIAGSGATGMAAALTTAEDGASVIIFEKMKKLIRIG
jgi:predicted flavoprotein YhiN